MLDDPSLYEDEGDSSADVDLSLDALAALDAEREARAKAPVRLAALPMFQTLFIQAVATVDKADADYEVLTDFAQHVVGALSTYFSVITAKGGKFYETKAAENAQKAERYRHDQSMRAHLLNGMLPALTIARHLTAWGAPIMRDWDDVTKRLFIAGFILHDFAKLKEAQQALSEAGFAELEAPSQAQIPVLETIFREWCAKLGLDTFLQPIGGMERYLHDLIYIAVNTQNLWGTGRSPDLLRKKSTPVNVHTLAAKIAHLADLLAYVAKTPPAVVANETIQKLITELGFDLKHRGQPVARLVYHHVAENRGLLLNFIHDAALSALSVPDQRVPLLYAPSGVVYIERADAPSMPTPEALVGEIVERIRAKAATTLIAKGKGAKRGNVGLQVDDSYADFFSLPEFVAKSPKLVERYIKNNKAPARLAAVPDWIGQEAMPHIPDDPKDARVDQLAEWAGLLEAQFRGRMDSFDLTSWLLSAWEVADLRPNFDAIREHPAARKEGGIKLWWFWAAAHAIQRKPGLNDLDTLTWLTAQGDSLAGALPLELPEKAKANHIVWDDLGDYVARVLTVGGAKAENLPRTNELDRYMRAKVKGGGAICAMCGLNYATREPKETVVSFQPGVYTARIKIGSSTNTRPLCSICGLEQLLRQLFINNLESGKKAEGERIRYLSFYPSYFFTRETLMMMRAVCNNLSDIRLSQKELRRVLIEGDLSDPMFWQRLEPFLLPPPSDKPTARLLRQVSESGELTYLTVGFRGFRDPTDTESWILPALYGLILSIALDVKVVATESGGPLMLEADELAETVWFDGAHPSVLAVMKQDRLRLDDIMGALSRLAAAYLIHLDTEFNGREENFHRFAPIAHALMESPLYVFHYLKKQERDDQMVGQERIRRYIGYAETLFNPRTPLHPEGDQLMSLAHKLVEQYRGFYRAKSISNANSVLRPLSVVADALLAADTRLFSDAESLTEVAYGELYRFMDRVGKGLADGRFPKGVSAREREEAMHTFCNTFVNDVFVGVFSRDVAALRGKQLNLLNSACQSLYRDMQYTEWAQRGQDADDTDIEDDTPA